MNYKEIIIKRIGEYINLKSIEIDKLIEVPPNPNMGDFTFSCFKLSDIIKESPIKIAKYLVEKINKDKFEHIESVGPYVNFFIDKGIFSESVISNILEQKDEYGANTIGNGKNVFIQYYHNKFEENFPLKIISTMLIGESIRRILSFCGYNAIKFISYLESGNLKNEYTNFKEINKIYSIFNIDLDSKKNFYNSIDVDIVKELEKRGILRNINDSKVIIFDDLNTQPYIIKKSNGDLTEAARDIKLAINKLSFNKFDKCIYIADKEKHIYFNQLFKTLDLINSEWVDKCVYMPVGLVKLESIDKYPMKLIGEFIEGIEDGIRDIANKNNIYLEESLVEELAIDIILLTYSKTSIGKNIKINLDDMLSLEDGGILNSQYSYIRAKEILRKFENVIIKPNFKKLNSIEEVELIRMLDRFPNVIIESGEKLDSSIINRYSLDLTSKFNKLLNLYNIKLSYEDKELFSARISLIKATVQVIDNSLLLMGIKNKAK